MPNKSIRILFLILWIFGIFIGGNFMYILVSIFTLFMAANYKNAGKFAMKSNLDFNNKLPKWVPWPIRDSESNYTGKNIVYLQYGYLIIGTFMFTGVIGQLLKDNNIMNIEKYYLYICLILLMIFYQTGRILEKQTEKSKQKEA